MPQSSADRSVDVSTPFSQFTLDVILSAGFGLKSDVQTNPDSELLKKATTVFNVPVYVRALSMFPFYRHLRKFIDLNPIQHVDYFETLARGIMKIRRNGSSGRKDLVQLMLEAQEVVNNNEVKTLTEEEIVAQCITFLVAGAETTGSTLAMIAYHLASYPEVQDKLLQEIDEATRTRGNLSTYELSQLFSAWTKLYVGHQNLHAPRKT